MRGDELRRRFGAPFTAMFGQNAKVVTQGIHYRATTIPMKSMAWDSSVYVTDRAAGWFGARTGTHLLTRGQSTRTPREGCFHPTGHTRSFTPSFPGRPVAAVSFSCFSGKISLGFGLSFSQCAMSKFDNMSEVELLIPYNAPSTRV